MSDLEFRPIGLVDQAALNFLKTKQLQVGFSYLDVWLYEHAVSFTVAKMMDEDLLSTVKTAVEDAIQNGTGFAAFKKTLKPYLISKGWWGEKIMLDPVDGVPKIVQLGSTRRLRTVYQTNIATAYAAGQWERIQATKDGLPYLRYNPSAATHKREAHMRYYGLVLPVDHPLWKQIYPPNGYGCLCSVSQLTQGQAERFGISEEPKITYTEVTNDRTGQTVRIPADITPTFAHNHGDRLGALEALFGERHGMEALAELKKQREHWLEERYRVPVDAVKIVSLPDKVDEKEVQRLLVDPLDGKEKRSEAIAGAQLQAALGVRLVRFDLHEYVDGKPQPGPDFMIVEEGVPKEKWKTVDFMYTVNPNNQYSIDSFNRNYAITKKRWNGAIENIQNHLKKTSIVPMDLRHLNAQNRAKLLDYVLSLPEEQRNQILLLVRETK